MTKHFTELIAWQECHKLVLLSYSLTENFPKKELFGLSSQVSRAAVSITSNIAEGYGRFSLKEKSYYNSIALGSLMELENQLIIAADLNYITSKDFMKVNDLITPCRKLIKSLNRFWKEASI